MDARWNNTEAYERYMGRWSTPAAERFLAWLQPDSGLTWLDVGCGTGALTKIILQRYDPGRVLGIDASVPFIASARAAIPDGRAHFQVSLAQALGIASGSADAVVCGLVLNFIPDPAQVMSEIERLCRPAGSIGLFVWDYARGMQMIRYFWDAAIALDEGARRLDQGAGSPLNEESGLKALADSAGLTQVETAALEIDTHFSSFGDYWEPFLAGTGAAPAYLKGLSMLDRERLEAGLRLSLPIRPDGSIHLSARLLALKARHR